MCLKVFITGDESASFDELRFPAMKLGAAFQKVNFLRDLKTDVHQLDRNYFPEIAGNTFNDAIKEQIINDIENDFSSSYNGIKKLPNKAKLPVLIAYYYYLNLLKKIKKIPAEKLIMSRIRISNFRKFILLIKAYLYFKMKLL
jgi:phytoene synthase